jgi:GntR family transcriptional regulator / MocR family aminotransferase
VELHVTFDGSASLSRQVYRQIQNAVLDGRLRPGDALPPSRELAARLSVSRTTVSAAYERLAAEGYVTTRKGAGTYVSGPQVSDTPPDDGGGGGALRPRPLWTDMPEPPVLSDSPAFDFRIGIPDARLFPYATWRRLLSDQMRQSAIGTVAVADPAGHPALRAAIARHVSVSRNVRATAEDVLVTNGSQQAMDLAARILLEPGACAAVEEPGYTMPRLLFDSLGARVVGVPVDEYGLRVDALPKDARLVYVTPSHQLPTGVPMSLSRRTALLSWAKQHDAAILEDDYDTEFRYTGRPLEPLHSLDRDGRVLYLGSFSKVLLPTLRIGFVVAPPSLRHALRAAKFFTDWHTNLPVQAALAGFIDQGGLARHVRRMRAVYRTRHELVSAALAGPLARWLEPVPAPVGLHASAYLRAGTAEDLDRLHASCATAGIGINHFGHVATGATRPGLLLGYGAIPTDRIPEGLELLVKHAETCLPPPPRHRPRPTGSRAR